MNAFAYVRVSGQSQKDKDGPMRQKRAIEGYALDNDIRYVCVYEELGVSGTKDFMDRPILHQLLQDLDETGVRTVLVEKIDRVARDLIVSELILAEFRKRGVKVIECETGHDLTVADGNPGRKFVRQILGAVAEMEKSMLVLKLRAARDRKRAETGRCEGPIPKVYDPFFVRRLQDMKREMSYEAIADKLASEDGQRWSERKVRYILNRQKARELTIAG